MTAYFETAKFSIRDQIKLFLPCIPKRAFLAISAQYAQKPGNTWSEIGFCAPIFWLNHGIQSS